jgi:glucose/arabinose dehydrogenase
MTRGLALLVALACLPPGVAAAAAPSITLVPVASGLADIVAATHAGDGSGRLFITLQDGQIVIFDGSQVLGTPFLDISSLVRCCGEEGLLSVAFHPNYPVNGFFYVYYVNNSGNLVVARYHVSGNPNVADPASAAILLVIPHPTNSNHNGGQLQFGPDGYLYIGTGDGGSGNDPPCNAQRDNTLLGKLLRIDVDQNVNMSPFYGIPPTNPFVGGGDPLDEIWAKGLRNPWRFSFDRLTGDLFIGDVGQSAREEVDFQPAAVAGGQNWGWKIMEGTQCGGGGSSGCPAGAPACNDPSLLLPILEYDHSGGRCSITGGYRYRGSQFPSLEGYYLYADYCSGEIFAASESGGTWSGALLLNTPHLITTFGEDESGELYVAHQAGNGTLYRIVVVNLSINDVTVTEGQSGSANASFTVFRFPSINLTSTAQFATANGTAASGTDYTAVSGTVTFPPGSTTQPVSVPVTGDLVDEDDETFFVNLTSPTNATISDGQGLGTILDDDPAPVMSIDDCAVVEGNAGSVSCGFTVSLSAPSSRTITVNQATANGTATAGVDYTAGGVGLTFTPGQVSKLVSVSVQGDTAVEGDEDFFVNLTGATNATVGDGQGVGTILDDDAPSLSSNELVHGAMEMADLGADPGPVADEDLYRLAQQPRASYEVVVDATSGDVSPLVMERLDSDNATVLQTSTAVGTGSSRSLRWENVVPGEVVGQHIRVRSGGCTTGCGTDDVYRIRAYETTYSIPRFNNAGSQATVLLLQNPTAYTITGHAYFWDGAGVLLYGQAFSIAPKGLFGLSAAGIPAIQGKGGTITVSNNGRYGDLTGKAIALEPATGFSFDSPMVSRPR